MQGDFSRLTAYPNATRVLMQQGRVQLDADWNELVALVVRRLRGVTADLVGPHGGPQDDLGYAISAAQGVGDFTLGAGRYYVAGWGCGTPGGAYTAQSDLPGAKALALTDASSLWSAPLELWGAEIKNLPEPGSALLVYLDVWERHVGAAEDEALLDVALGGLDTATRAVLMAQVHVVPAPAGARTPRGGPRALPSEEQLFAHLRALFPEARRPLLRARARQAEKDADPCLSDPDARYRGAENQLYRVEIQRGGVAGRATLKWSRDNGSIVFPVDDLSGTTATLRHLGRDDRSTLAEGQWVELIDEVRAKRGAPGCMAQVTKLDRDAAKVTLDPAPGVTLPAFADLTRPFLRRWDHAAGLAGEGGATLDEGALVVRETDDENDWIELEDGVEIQFRKPLPPADEPDALPEAQRYRSGDHWLIPARTATGDVQWPRDGSGHALPRAPDGVRHHYAPLALVTLDAAGHVTLLKDCRRAFEALAKPVA